MARLEKSRTPALGTATTRPPMNATRVRVRVRGGGGEGGVWHKGNIVYVASAGVPVLAAGARSSRSRRRGRLIDPHLR